LQTVLYLYSDRVLSFDSPTAEIAGALSDPAHGRGHAPGFPISSSPQRRDGTA